MNEVGLSLQETQLTVSVASDKINLSSEFRILETCLPPWTWQLKDVSAELDGDNNECHFYLIL